MKNHLLRGLMVLVTLLTAGGFFLSLYAFRAQEEAMDSMMGSYVLDLADTFVDGGAPGRGPGHRNRPMGPMGFRMLTRDPALKSGEAGGVLLLGPDGRIRAGSPGAERLAFLAEKGLLADEPRKVRGEDGVDYYGVLKELEFSGEGRYFILAAVSRTVLLGPLIGLWRFWIVTALATSAAILVGVILLWRYLTVPLGKIVEVIRRLKWGKDRPVALYDGPLYELESLASVIETLAEEAWAKEDLKGRYVTDLVRVEEDTRKFLARELHDGPLQSSVAAIKRIQMARELLPTHGLDGLGDHLRTAEEVTQVAAGEIRDYCDELSPSWVTLGPAEALEENGHRLSRVYGAVEISVEADEGLDFLDEERTLALVRIFQEAVSNSVCHGEALSVKASLKREGGALRFTVEDDGRGFEAAGLSQGDFEVLRTTGHRGLANMNERARLLGGIMTLDSAPGRGCKIDIVFPLRREGEDDQKGEE